jgi:hypothetical protein
MACLTEQHLNQTLITTGNVVSLLFFQQHFICLFASEGNENSKNLSLVFLYSALLWHRLMGKNVLSANFSGTDKIRAYAHCAKGSVS